MNYASRWIRSAPVRTNGRFARGYRNAELNSPDAIESRERNVPRELIYSDKFLGNKQMFR